MQEVCSHSAYMLLTKPYESKAQGIRFQIRSVCINAMMHVESMNQNFCRSCSILHLTQVDNDGRQHLLGVQTAYIYRKNHDTVEKNISLPWSWHCCRCARFSVVTISFWPGREHPVRFKLQSGFLKEEEDILEFLLTRPWTQASM